MWAMSWEAQIEDLILTSWAHRRRLKLTPGNLREQGLAMDTIGSAVVAETGLAPTWAPVIAKCVGYALGASRPEVTCVTEHVAGIVAGMRVEAPPERAPRLMSGDSFFVRTRCAADLLPGVRAVWGYRWLNAWYVNIVDTRGEVFSHRGQVRWDAPSFDGAFEDAGDAPHTIAPGTAWLYRDRILPAFRWVVALGMLLDARGAPIEVTDSTRTLAVLRPKDAKRAAGMTYRTVRVSSAGVHAVRRAQAGGAVDREGLTKREVIVRGFLRNQACGPGMAQRRLVYIDSFMSSRWARDEPRPQRTTVRRAESAHE